jgi:hypothetical protein
MARFPKVDSPCPLDMDEQKRLDGYCNRCHKQVHVLDGMDDAGRAAWLAAAEGPVCVSYRRSSRIASIAAIAITLVAGTAFAGEECADTPLSALISVSRQQVTPVDPAQGQLLAGVESSNTDAQESDLLELVIVGGIRDPRDAEWVDDSDLPELPVKVVATVQVDNEAQPPPAKL